MKNILFNCFNESDLNDNIFKPSRIWLSSNNKSIQKDDKNQGFSYFGTFLRSKNFNIHTQDFWKKNDKIDLQINFAYHQKINCEKSYLLLPESKEIYEKNDLEKLKNLYTKIFCQYDKYVDNKKIFKLNYPFVIKKNFEEKYDKRQLFSCMISTNKSSKKKLKNDLYHKRFELIDFVEKNKLNHFELYGMDWNLPYKKSGFFGRILNLKNKIFLKKNKLNCYKGMADSKSSVLRNAKFVFCIENFCLEGYISDPIFDAFNNGCVPIYLGPKNVSKYIPENTFIDLRKFKNFSEVFQFLENINSFKYFEMQKNIIDFINSEKIADFNELGFTSKIVNHLNEDIK